MVRVNKYLVYLNPDEKSKESLDLFASSMNLAAKKPLHVTLFGFYSSTGIDRLVSEFREVINDAETPIVYCSTFLGIKSYAKENKPDKLVITLSNPDIERLHIRILDIYKNYLNSKEDNHRIMPDSEEFMEKYGFFLEKKYTPHITLAEAKLSPSIKYSFFNNFLSKSICFESIMFARKDDEWKIIDKQRIGSSL